MVQSLIAQGFEVLPVEPNVELQSNEPGLDFVTIDSALEQMDLGFKLVGHKAFRKLPEDIIKFVNG